MRLKNPIVFSFLVAALALPWLWPVTWGPLTNAIPWMVSAWCALLALVLALFLDESERFLGFASSLTLAAGLSAIMAWLQWFNAEDAFAPIVAQASPGMAYGNLRQPNQLASLLVLGMWAGLWLWQHGKSLPSLVRHLALALYLCLLSGALVATGSRVGLLHVLMLLLICLFWRVSNQRSTIQKSWLRWSFAITAMTALWAYVGIPVLQEFTSASGQRNVLDRLTSAENTCGSRILLWRNVLYLIGQKPWTGWGWGNLDWAHYMSVYPSERFCHILDNAHNLPLHFAVELGVPVTILIALIALFWLFSRKPWVESRPDQQLCWGILLVVFIHSMVEYPLWYGGFQITTLAALLYLSDIHLNRARSIGIFVTACAFFLAYGGWDYWRVSQPFLSADKRSSFFKDNPMGNAQKSFLFKGTVQFAELTVTKVTTDNAEHMRLLGKKVLHYSPEPRVIRKILEASEILHDQDSVREQALHFQEVYPLEYERWLMDSAQ